MPQKRTTLFSAGWCPVAPGAGQLIVLVRQDTSEGLFYCPSCGTAWTEHPGNEVALIQSLEELAPGGVRLPSRVEAVSLGVPLEDVAYEDWDFDLDDVLGLPA